MNKCKEHRLRSVKKDREDRIDARREWGKDTQKGERVKRERIEKNGRRRKKKG